MNRDTPVFSTIETALIPSIRDSPNRVKMAILFAFFLAIAITYVLSKDQVTILLSKILVTMTKQLENTRVSDEINAPLVVSKSRLEGSVIVSGAKNSALRLLAASILTDEPVELSGFPNGLLM